MNRKDLQTLSDLRVKEGRALIKEGLCSGAYYLLGYAVECALKACICRHISRYDFPDKKLINQSYSHSFKDLLGAAGDKAKKFTDEMERNKILARNWSQVLNWETRCRYEYNVPDKKVKQFFVAINDRQNGVLTWLKKCW